MYDFRDWFVTPGMDYKDWFVNPLVDYKDSSWTNYVGSPRHKLSEKDGVVTLKIIMAGATKSGIHVYEKNNYLYVSYVGSKDNHEVSDFDRKWSLSDDIDASKITSEYKDGMLIITLPKKEFSENEIKVK